jgi:hypothetical protein
MVVNFNERAVNMFKRIWCIPIFLVLVTAVCCFAGDDSVSDFLKTLHLPGWASALLGVVLGSGFFGTIAAKFFIHIRNARDVLKKVLKLIEIVKPLLKDSVNITAYNEVVESLEVLLNGLKISKTLHFLERFKLHASIDHEKVLNAVRLSPIINAGNDALDQEVKS